MFSSVIVSGALAQDHEFIYPYYRLLEANSKLDVCLIGGKPVQGILGTQLPPNKNHPVKDIDKIKVADYDLLVLPGGVKAMEKVSEKFFVGALGYALFDNKKFKERIRQEVREAVADILLNSREEKKWRDHYSEKVLNERTSKRADKINKAFIKHFEEDILDKLGKK